MGLFLSDKKMSKSDRADDLFKAGEAAFEKSDYGKAAAFYKKAAELGHAQSMSYLAYCYRFGKGVPENAKEAFSWYQKAYRSGRGSDAGNLGAMYHYDEIDGATDDEVMALLLEGAKNGNFNAYIPLTERYYFEEFGQANAKLAAYWAYRAHQEKQVSGSYYMGMFYYDGTFFPKVPAYAKYYLEEFLSLGGDDEQVTDLLKEEAFEKVAGIKPVLKPFVDKLPEGFFDCADPQEMFYQGVELTSGYDDDDNPVPQDIEKGIALIRAAAEQGYAKAQRTLGQCYLETDEPCPVFFDDGSLNIYKSDGKQAVYWLTKAADQGEIPAMDTLIPMFTNGSGGAEKNRILVRMYSDMRQKLTGEAFEAEAEEAKRKETYADGYNVIHFGNGDVYEGNVVDGMFHAEGKYTSHKGWVYEGYFAFDEANGHGKITYADGAVYTGHVRAYMPDGYGKLEDPDGSVRRGCWKNGIMHGLCSHYFANGDVYHGELDNGNYTGIGLYIFKNGGKEAGLFENGECLTQRDVMQHKASFKNVTSGAASYYGQMRAGYVDGQTVVCPNGYGERYEGDSYEVGVFNNSTLIHGAYSGESSVSYGDFDEKGRLNGEGWVLFIEDSGLVCYKGGFLNNRYQGKGSYTRSDGQRFLAQWENGKPIRIEQTFAANGEETRKLSYTGCMEDEGYILSLEADD